MTPGRHRSDTGSARRLAPLAVPAAGLSAVALFTGTVIGVPFGSSSADAYPVPPEPSPPVESMLAGPFPTLGGGSATAADPAQVAESSPEAARLAYERAATRLGRTAVVNAGMAAGPGRSGNAATPGPGAAVNPALAARRWLPAMTGVQQTSPFGPRWGRLHAGLDFSATVGSPVRAMSSGTVTFAGMAGGYGNKVEITYWDGMVSYYGHLSAIRVAKGDAVTPGQLVARSGNTGRSTGPHLHLEVHPAGKEPIDPAPWLRARGAMSR